MNNDFGQLKNIHYGDIHGHLRSQFSLKDQNLPYINLDVNLSKYQKDDYCQIGDIIVADASEDLKDIGKLIEIIDLNGEKVLSGLHTIHARQVDSSIYNGFMSYVLHSNYSRKQINIIAQGVSVLGISKVKFADISIILPRKQEQQKIADFLTTVDKRVEQLTQKADLLDKYKKSMMQQLFSQGLRFSDDQGNSFDDWETKKLKSFAKKINKKNVSKEFINVLTNSAKFGIINQEDYFDREIANQNNIAGYYIVEKDDFVYNPRISSLAPVGPIGRNNGKTGVMSPLYLVFRVKNQNIDFIEYYFKSTFWYKYMNQIANFGARHDRMNVTNDDFFDMPVSLPSLPEQQKIADFLKALDQQIKMVREQLAQTQAFKQGLLQRMFV